MISFIDSVLGMTVQGIYAHFYTQSKRKFCVFVNNLPMLNGNREHCIYVCSPAGLGRKVGWGYIASLSFGDY